MAAREAAGETGGLASEAARDAARPRAQRRKAGAPDAWKEEPGLRGRRKKGRRKKEGEGRREEPWLGGRSSARPAAPGPSKGGGTKKGKPEKREGGRKREGRREGRKEGCGAAWPWTAARTRWLEANGRVEGRSRKVGLPEGRRRRRRKGVVSARPAGVGSKGKKEKRERERATEVRDQGEEREEYLEDVIVDEGTDDCHSGTLSGATER